MKKIERICKKWENGENFTKKDAEYIAYFELNEVGYDEADYIENIFMDIMINCCDYWDDYDENYPDNPYYWGYCWDDVIFITNYSGVAGKYWQDENSWTICKW